LFTVELGEVTAFDPHPMARRQRVVGVALNALCPTNRCRRRADYFWKTTTQFGEGTAELVGLCAEHREGNEQPADMAALQDAGVGVRVLGEELSAFVRRYELDVASGACPCRVVASVSVATGLRLYIDSLWVLADATRQEDGTLRMRCWECGTNWRYDRKRGEAHRE
jgi:hypothetical protein